MKKNRFLFFAYDFYFSSFQLHICWLIFHICPNVQSSCYRIQCYWYASNYYQYDEYDKRDFKHGRGDFFFLLVQYELRFSLFGDMLYVFAVVVWNTKKLHLKKLFRFFCSVCWIYIWLMQYQRRTCKISW